MKVQVLSIAHRHGTNVSVYATFEGARCALADYCREWWLETGRAAKDMPATDDGVIDEYFERMLDEFGEIIECEVGA